MPNILRTIAAIYLLFSIFAAYIIYQDFGEIKVVDGINPINGSESYKAVKNKLGISVVVGTTVQGILVFFLFLGVAESVAKASDVEIDTQNIIEKIESLESRLLKSISSDKSEEVTNIDDILDDIEDG